MAFLVSKELAKEGEMRYEVPSKYKVLWMTKQVYHNNDNDDDNKSRQRNGRSWDVYIAIMFYRIVPINENLSVL